MSAGIRCRDHGELVRLAAGEPVICHQDGRSCGSGAFTLPVLDRGQAMILLITERGMEAMRGVREHT